MTPLKPPALRAVVACRASRGTSGFYPACLSRTGNPRFSVPRPAQIVLIYGCDGGEWLWSFCRSSSEISFVVSGDAAWSENGVSGEGVELPLAISEAEAPAMLHFFSLSTDPGGNAAGMVTESVTALIAMVSISAQSASRPFQAAEGYPFPMARPCGAHGSEKYAAFAANSTKTKDDCAICQKLERNFVKNNE